MNLDHIAEEYLAVASEIFTELREPIREASRDIVRRLRAGNKVMFCGNGGSAADAQHFAAEFVNRFLLERAPLAGLSLTTDTSTLTSIGNDYGFAAAFAKQVEGLGREGDLLVAISTSGNAENVLRAVDAAHRHGVAVLALTGGAGGRLAQTADRVLCLAATSHTPRIQEGHHLVMHLICEDVEEQMAAAATAPPIANR
jgi:D-sedoheptulose 7-phosphate isomerase